MLKARIEGRNLNGEFGIVCPAFPSRRPGTAASCGDRFVNAGERSETTGVHIVDDGRRVGIPWSCLLDYTGGPAHLTVDALRLKAVIGRQFPLSTVEDLFQPQAVGTGPYRFAMPPAGRWRLMFSICSCDCAVPEGGRSVRSN